MTVLMIHSKVRTEYKAAAEAGVKRLFAAVERAQPQGIRYASLVLPDGETYVALLQIDEGVENPLPGLPEFLEFGENLKKWRTEPPVTEQLTVVGSYRLF